MRKIKLKYSNEYYKNNPNCQEKYKKSDKAKRTRNEWTKIKLKEDINFKIIVIIRNRINRALKNNYKITSTKDLLGCSIDELKIYLAGKFKKEMTWDNHGSIWEIYHIRPCSSFDLSDPEQQKLCFHYSNLQPLFSTTKIAESFGYKEIGNKNKQNLWPQ